MFDRNSLVTQLGWRLAIVLSIGTVLQVAWLFVHFRGVEAGYADAGLIDELLDFFKDVAWTTPIIGITTFIACTAGMKRHLEPLRQLSEQAARIAPGDKHTALTVEQAPSEVQPLVVSVNTGFRAPGRGRRGPAPVHGQCCPRAQDTRRRGPGGPREIANNRRCGCSAQGNRTHGPYCGPTLEPRTAGGPQWNWRRTPGCSQCRAPGGRAVGSSCLRAACHLGVGRRVRPAHGVSDGGSAH